jgi:hypothetical protein
MPDPIEAHEVFRDGDELGSGGAHAEPSGDGSVGLFLESEGSTFADLHLTPVAAARLGERLIKAAEDVEANHDH